MNVLMMMKDSEIGGVASCVASLADGLKRYKNVKTVIATSDGDSVGTMLKDVIIIDFASKNPWKVIKNYRTIKQVIKKEGIQIIHAQNRIPAFYAAFYCFFHRNVKYIWSNHLVPLPSDFIHRMLTLYGECAVAEGIDGQEMLINDFHISPDKVAAVNLGVDFDNFKKSSPNEQEELRKEYNIQENEKLILLYGRLAPIKGHDFLLDSMGELTDKNFRIIFPGENEEYKQHVIGKAKKLGLESKLIFPGYIDGSQWLSIADLMVLPSKQEGFGIVNVEAFVMGVPVIRTTTAGYKDMQDLCFGVKYGDVAHLSELLKMFFDNNEIFEEKRIYAQENCQRFSLKSYTDGYFEVYEKAIKR